MGKTPEIIQAAECCLMVSGSVSLELLARGTPAVVIYYWGWISGLLVRLLVFAHQEQYSEGNRRTNGRDARKYMSLHSIDVLTRRDSYLTMQV